MFSSYNQNLCITQKFFQYSQKEKKKLYRYVRWREIYIEYSDK